jgi:hypothetical protein
MYGCVEFQLLLKEIIKYVARALLVILYPWICFTLLAIHSLFERTDLICQTFNFSLLLCASAPLRE